jgi:hypothetical protein
MIKEWIVWCGALVPAAVFFREQNVRVSKPGVDGMK